MLAQTHQEVFLRSCDLLASPFAKKARLAGEAKWVRRKTMRFAQQICAVQAQKYCFIRIACDSTFHLRLLCQRKAELRFTPYRNKDTQAVSPLFLFAKRGTKRKSSQKEKCRLGSFAYCGERQGLTSPLTCAHSRGGSDGFVRTHRQTLIYRYIYRRKDRALFQ